jgi:hypothetical protein
MPKKHNRLGMVAVIIIVLVITIVFALNGLLPKLDLIGGNRLLVVIPDSFSGDSMLTAYVNDRAMNWIRSFQLSRISALRRTVFDL